MGRKRGKDQILRRILEVCAGGRGRLRHKFVHCSRLNFHIMVSYLNLVAKNVLMVRAACDAFMHKTTGEKNRSSSAIRELIPD